MKGIVLHGGKGSRLRPLTHTGPKQLIPIANKPISQYVLEDLKEAGVEDVTIVLGDIAPERVMDFYGDGSQFGMKISYVQQGEPKGIAHAVSLCRNSIGEERFVVYLGDNLIKGGIKAFANEFCSLNFDAMVLLCRVKNPEAFGVAELDKNGRLVRLIEKPKKPPSNYALAGIYFLTAMVFDVIKDLKPSWRGELEITEAIQALVDGGYNVEARVVSGWWKDTGTPEDILEANRLVLEDLETNIAGIVEEGASIQGKLVVGKNTRVSRGSVVRGPAIIGENCDIGSDIYIGPYTSIGNNVVIRSGEVENSIIMSDCLIDCKKRIVDSILGAGSRIVSIENSLPKGHRFLLGERSSISI